MGSGSAPADRIHCCVPFCRRWMRSESSDEMICAEHWRRIPLARRKVWNRIRFALDPDYRRRWRKPPRWLTAISRGALHGRDRAALNRLWESLKREAIERAL